MISKAINETTVRIGEVRFSYANVFTPTSIDENTEKKYNIAILIPKSDTQTVTIIRQAIANAVEEGKTKKWGGKLPAKKDNLDPLRDGDEEFLAGTKGEEYKGCYFLNAKSGRKPVIMDTKHNVLTSDDEFYSGCYGAATINFFSYDKGASKGIGVGLNSLLKIRDGERIGSSSNPDVDFADLFDEEDSNANGEDW